MVFSSYAVGLFGLFVLEFSLWNNFGNYIWYVSIGFTILDMFVGDIVSYQLKEVSSWVEKERELGSVIFFRPLHPHQKPRSLLQVTANNCKSLQPILPMNDPKATTLCDGMRYFPSK